jgi:hypothetical protein
VIVDKVTRTADKGYATTQLDLHTAEILSLLGISSLSEATQLGVNADGSYITSFATYDGWRKQDGSFSTWGTATPEGDTAKVCVKYVPNGEYSICTMPGRVYAGEVFTTRWAFATATDTVILKAIITIKAAAAPPTITTPADGELAGTFPIAITTPRNNSYATTSVDFNLAPVAAALGVGVDELEDAYLWGIKDDGTFQTTWTGNAGEYWLNREGTTTGWGSTAYAFIGTSNYTSFSVGQYPSATAVGDVFTPSLYLLVGDKYVVLNFTITIDAGVGIDEVTADSEVIATQYFTLDGKQVDAAPADGVYIVRTIYANGTATTEKVIK